MLAIVKSIAPIFLIIVVSNVFTRTLFFPATGSGSRPSGWRPGL